MSSLFSPSGPASSSDSISSSQSFAALSTPGFLAQHASRAAHANRRSLTSRAEQPPRLRDDQAASPRQSSPSSTLQAPRSTSQSRFSPWGPPSEPVPDLARRSRANSSSSSSISSSGASFTSSSTLSATVTTSSSHRPPTNHPPQDLRPQDPSRPGPSSLGRRASSASTSRIHTPRALALSSPSLSSGASVKSYASSSSIVSSPPAPLYRSPQTTSSSSFPSPPISSLHHAPYHPHSTHHTSRRPDDGDSLRYRFRPLTPLEESSMSTFLILSADSAHASTSATATPTQNQSPASSVPKLASDSTRPRSTSNTSQSNHTTTTTTTTTTTNNNNNTNSNSNTDPPSRRSSIYSTHSFRDGKLASRLRKKPKHPYQIPPSSSTSSTSTLASASASASTPRPSFSPSSSVTSLNKPPSVKSSVMSSSTLSSSFSTPVFSHTFSTTSSSTPSSHHTTATSPSSFSSPPLPPPLPPSSSSSSSFPDHHHHHQNHQPKTRVDERPAHQLRLSDYDSFWQSRYGIPSAPTTTGYPGVTSTARDSSTSRSSSIAADFDFSSHGFHDTRSIYSTASAGAITAPPTRQSASQWSPLSLQFPSSTSTPDAVAVPEAASNGKVPPSAVPVSSSASSIIPARTKERSSFWRFASWGRKKSSSSASTAATAAAASHPNLSGRSSPAAAASRAAVRCSRCWTTLDVAQLAVLACEHRYCVACLQQLTVAFIHDHAQLPPRCCSRVISVASLQRVLSETEVQALHAAFVRHAESCFPCPRSSCREPVLRSPPPHTTKSPSKAQPHTRPTSRDRSFTTACAACSLTICTLCWKEAHALGTLCPEFSAGGQPPPQTPPHSSHEEAFRQLPCLHCQGTVSFEAGQDSGACVCGVELCSFCGSRWTRSGCVDRCRSSVVSRGRRHEERHPQEKDVSGGSSSDGTGSHFQGDRNGDENVPVQDWPDVQQLLAKQAREKEAFLASLRAKIRRKRSEIAGRKREIMDAAEREIEELTEKHSQAIDRLEERQLAAEIQLRESLALEQRNAEIRLRHMEAYCGGKNTPRASSTAGGGASSSARKDTVTDGAAPAEEEVPRRAITDADLRELVAQYNVRDNMSRMHKARIKVLGDQQSKRMDAVLLKQEAEIAQVEMRRDERTGLLAEEYSQWEASVIRGALFEETGRLTLEKQWREEVQRAAAGRLRGQQEEEEEEEAHGCVRFGAYEDEVLEAMKHEDSAAAAAAAAQPGSDRRPPQEEHGSVDSSASVPRHRESLAVATAARPPSQDASTLNGTHGHPNGLPHDTANHATTISHHLDNNDNDNDNNDDGAEEGDLVVRDDLLVASMLSSTLAAEMEA